MEGKVLALSVVFACMAVGGSVRNMSTDAEQFSLQGYEYPQPTILSMENIGIREYFARFIEPKNVSSLSEEDQGARVWPPLKFSWRIIVATIIGFTGSACGTVGGVGGGGIFVPMLNLIVGFDTKSAAALSKCMIMGASVSSVWYNMRVRHPTKEVPIIDYDLALLFQPMLMLGITAGVTLSIVFPYWLITIFIIVLFIGTSLRSFFKGIEIWQQETEKKDEEKLLLRTANNEVNANAVIDILPSQEAKTGTFDMVCFNFKWKSLLVLMLVWIAFLILQLLKNASIVCGTKYWIFNILQLPVALGVSLCEAIILHKRSRRKKSSGNTDDICGALIDWKTPQLFFCVFCGITGGIVGGLLGSGGGFILGPLLLDLGVIPQVASATATFVMMFSSSLSVVEFYFLGRFPLYYALYLIAVSMLAGFWGQYFIRKLVTLLGRSSIIVFALSGIIFVSALVMGALGIERSISMIRGHQYMGFLDLCKES